MRYRKKPVEVEAIQVPVYDPDRDITEYLNECIALGEWCGGIVHMMGDEDDDHILIRALEGDMKALPGYYIIKGVTGEFYPCKPNVFIATYELVRR